MRMAKWAETCNIAFNFEFLTIKLNVNKVALEKVKSVNLRGKYEYLCSTALMPFNRRSVY
jgi:hypothetical protein